MSSILKYVSGDKTIWAIAALLAIYSFLPVYSSSSNLEYVVGNGTVGYHLLKHFVMLVIGFGIMFLIHKIPTHYFSGLSLIAMPVVVLLLMYTLAQGSTIGGANASRWIRIPFLGIGFQTSTLALVVTMVYVARYLSILKKQEAKVRFSQTILPLWVPVLIVVGLIFPANFSTAAMLFSLVLVLCFVGGYPIKYLLVIVSAGVLFGLLFITAAKAFPDAFPNRVDTWVSRIENFGSDEVDPQANYQVERANIAIATGGLFGVGAGKSVMKNFLPQSSSDFIYAIIIEEYGLVGGLLLLLTYLLFLFRVMVIAHRSERSFSKLVVLGLGIPFVFQALINMGVAVSLLPVTGQTLPLISSGGTSIWMNCMAIGVILSASVKGGVPNEVLESEKNPLEILSEQL
jgi:cell division protein FtsW